MGNSISSTSLPQKLCQPMLLHSELSKSTFATSTKLQWMTTLIPEVLVRVIFQTLSVAEGRVVVNDNSDT